MGRDPYSSIFASRTEGATCPFVQEASAHGQHLALTRRTVPAIFQSNGTFDLQWPPSTSAAQLARLDGGRRSFGHVSQIDALLCSDVRYAWPNALVACEDAFRSNRRRHSDPEHLVGKCRARDRQPALRADAHPLIDRRSTNITLGCAGAAIGLFPPEGGQAESLRAIPAA